MANQYVTLVPVGGTPIRLADQKGTPYATSGSGALIFGTAPTLYNPTLVGVTYEGGSGFGDGTLVAPAIYFGQAGKGFYSTGVGNISAAAQGARLWSADAPGDFTLGRNLILPGSSSGSTTLSASPVASGVLVLPAASDTLVARATTDTLTNKTINGASNTITNVSLSTGVTGTLGVSRGGTSFTGYATGDILYASALNTLSRLAIGSNGTVLTASAGVPVWSAATSAPMPSGTAAAPGLPFAAATTTGFYLSSVSGNSIGMSAQGRSVATLSLRPAPFENAWLRLGTDAPISVTSTDTFVATLGTPSVTISGAQPRVTFFNMGSIGLTATDTVTKVNPSCMLELDKIDVQANAGPVIFNKMLGIRVRTPVPYNDVTIVEAVGLELPFASTSGTGSITNLYGLHFVTPAGPNITNYYGIYYGSLPGAGSIASASSIPINIWGGSSIEIVSNKATGLSGNVTINAANTASTVRLQSNSKDVLLIEEATTNYFRMSTTGGSNTPMLRSGGGATVGMFLSTRGVAGFSFYQEDQSRQIFSIEQAATAVNRVNVKAAATGVAPEVQASGETNINLILRANGTGLVEVLNTLAVSSNSSRAAINMAQGTPSSPNSADFWYDGSALKFQDGATLRTLTWV